MDGPDELDVVPAEAARMAVWLMGQNARMTGAMTESVIESQQRQIEELQATNAALREELEQVRARAGWVLGIGSWPE